MKYLKVLVLLNLTLFLFSCGSFKEGFKNQKKENSDEFLVEKKSPLVMPPNYNDLPIPNTNQKEIQESDSKIKSLISKDQSQSSASTNNQTDKSFEEKLLEKIKSN